MAYAFQGGACPDLYVVDHGIAARNFLHVCHPDQIGPFEEVGVKLHGASFAGNIHLGELQPSAAIVAENREGIAGNIGTAAEPERKRCHAPGVRRSLDVHPVGRKHQGGGSLAMIPAHGDGL